MKYKINHLRCFWLTYTDTKTAFFDWLDNEWVGIILTNFLYYVFSIVFLPLFIVLTFIWYFKRVYDIKNKLPYLDKAVINTLKRRKIIMELTHQQEDKGE